jgi:molybdenum cofactor cytidylyltransferase
LQGLYAFLVSFPVLLSKSLPTVIVLAAGRSARFRAASGGQDKLHASLGQRSVREHTLAAVQSSGLPWHIVEPAHTAHIGLPGMGDSIATGVRACAQAAGWLILPADLPLVVGRAAALARHCRGFADCGGDCLGAMADA